MILSSASCALALTSAPLPDAVGPSGSALSKNLRDFLLKCFKKEPQMRPPAQALLSHAWVRTGPISSFVWNIAPYLDWTYFPTLRAALDGLGLEKWDVSRHVRIGVLAWWTGVVFCLLLAGLQRYWLRLLLSWQGWLFGRPKGLLAKAKVTLWGANVKLVSGRRPLLYSRRVRTPRATHGPGPG